MHIPKKVRTKYREWIYIKQVNDKLFLYEDSITKSKMTFSKYELGMIDNTEIDKKLQIEPKCQNKKKLVLHDILTDKEIDLFHTQAEVAKYLGTSCSTVRKAIIYKKWIKKRYFVEYVEVKDEQK